MEWPSRAKKRVSTMKPAAFSRVAARRLSSAGTTASASPCSSSAGVAAAAGSGSAAPGRRPAAATTAATGQRPLATASSAMIAPCEKPNKATRSSRPAKPRSASAADTTRSNPSRACSTRCWRLSAPTPATLNHCRPGPPPSNRAGASGAAKAADGRNADSGLASGARSAPEAPIPWRKTTRLSFAPDKASRSFNGDARILPDARAGS